MTRGAHLEVDGRLGDIPCENVRGNYDSPGRDFGELVRLLVVLARHVVEFYAEKLSARARTALQYASILSSWQLALFI
jgi:hypothetical protein